MKNNSVSEIKLDVSADELYELFYVAAYGCHRQCEQDIRQAFYDHRNDNSLFLSFEWFLSQPLPKAMGAKIGWQDWEKDVYIFAPFAPRLAEHSVVVPVRARGNKLELSFRTVDAFRNLKLRFRWDESLNVRTAWAHWSGKRTRKKNLTRSVEKKLDTGKIRTWRSIRDREGRTYSIGWIDQWTYEWQGDIYPKLCKDPVTKLSLDALALLYRPLFVDNYKRPVRGIFVPIASSRLFYGGVWVMFPGLVDEQGAEAHQRAEQFIMGVGLRVAQLISRTYLPVLAVLHENWLEHLHDRWLKSKKGKKNKKEKLPAKADCVFNARLSSVVAIQDGGTSGASRGQRAKFRNVYFQLGDLRQRRQPGADDCDEIESLLNKLWRRRDDLTTVWEQQKGTNANSIEEAAKTKAYLDHFKDTLLFKKYLICSESMTKLLSKVIIAAKTLLKPEGSKTLPACLVVGGAGSGKETLAEMLRLFSDGKYYQGKDYVINMAAIRPAPLTAVVIGGLESVGDPFKEFKLKGVLQRIREEARGGEGKPTIRFDEFNSMDPDSQGVLLRFLDNSEVIPVGGLDDEIKDHTDFLVIGIMNEDPDEISREGAMEFFKNSTYLGSVLGDLLYEQFFKLRRLRPDIMYRMKRNGKFVIPPLRDRRQDVPLLFYIFVRDELKSHEDSQPQEGDSGGSGTPSKKIANASRELHLSLEVLNRLMQPDLKWQGNIRELQALAKIVAERLIREPGHTVVTLRIVEKALLDVGLVAIH